MAVLNPDHLLEQAEALIARRVGTVSRQADLRRAISTAYYALFHFVLTEAADEFVGDDDRTTMRYSLIYRAIDHRALRQLCEEVTKQTPSRKYKRFLPDNGWQAHLPAFASALIELQDKRHDADYDPAYRATRSDARLAVSTARGAISRYRRASVLRRKTFLALLLATPR